jgi:DNA-binding beta-propeller fold protein YncE
VYFVVETDGGAAIREASIANGQIEETPIGESEARLSTRSRFFLSGALPFDLGDLYQLHAAKFDEVFELERSVLLPRGSSSSRALVPETDSDAWRLVTVGDDGSDPLQSAPLGSAVYGAGGVPGSDRLYVVVKENSDASLLVIDGLKVSRTIDLPAVALPIAEGRTADELILSRGNALLVVDTSAGTVVHDIVFAGSVNGIAVDLAHGRAYVGRENSSFISIVDLSAGKIVDEFKRGRTAARSGKSPAKYAAVRADAATILASSTIVGSGAQANEGQILLGEGGRFVYVLTKEARDVTVYDAQAEQVVAHIPTGAGPTQLVRGTPGSRMYAVANDRVTLIDTETNEAIEQYRASRSEWSFRPFLVVDHTHGLLFAFGKKTLEAIWAEDGRTLSLTAHRPDDVLLLGAQCTQRRFRF